MTRAMIIESKIPKTFWPEALATSVYLINRLLTQILDFQTPLQVLSTTTEIPLPLTLQPRIFRSSVFVHIPKHERDKLSPCAIKCVFVGYGVNQKGYRCYDPKTKHMFTTMNCDFLESEYFFNHLSGQGESDSNNSDKSNEDDPLSWLSMSSPHQADQTEEVSGTAEPISEVQPLTGSDISENVSPKLISDVSTSASDSDSDDNPDSTNDNVNEIGESQEHEIQENVELDGAGEVDGDTGRYVLPPKANRGVPPKRYSPEKIVRNARYSILNSAKGEMSKMAQAFEEALLEEEEIPHSVEEAMKHKH